jgi:hypothetical protein
LVPDNVGFPPVVGDVVEGGPMDGDRAQGLIVRRNGDGDLALVVGEPTWVEQLGQVVDHPQGRTVERLLGNLGVGAGVVALANSARGAWVRLAPETVAHLASGELKFGTDANGFRLATLRGDDGRIGHISRFAGDVVPANPVAAGLLLQGLATSMQMRRLERDLAEIAEGVGTLVEHAQVEHEAELAASMDTIRRVERRVGDRGVVDDRDWVSVAAHPVRKLRAMTTTWLQPLEHLFEDGKLTLRRQVELSRSQLGSRDLGFWLRMHAYGELALTRWEQLYLLHEADAAPERLASEARRIEDEARERWQELQTLHRRLAGHLVDTPELGRWERLQIINRVRLARLQLQLGHVANAYADALGEPRQDLPAYMPPDASELGPLLDLDQFRAAIGEGIADGVRAGGELARDAGQRTGALALGAGQRTGALAAGAGQRTGAFARKAWSGSTARLRREQEGADGDGTGGDPNADG